MEARNKTITPYLMRIDVTGLRVEMRLDVFPHPHSQIERQEIVDNRDWGNPWSDGHSP